MRDFPCWFVSKLLSGAEKSKRVSACACAADIISERGLKYRAVCVFWTVVARKWLLRSLCCILLGICLAAPVAAADAVERMVAAVAAGRAEMVRDLLVQGVDANIKNGSGRPVLVLAGFNGNRRTSMALLAAGADVDAVDASGTTALMAASALGHKELVDLLIVAGADVNMKDAAGRSALARASLGGHGAVVEALKAAGAAAEE
jgi:hypothetical protein